MRIHSMTATFGKLQNARLELNGGLNLIQAPNEGGKSTWCAFLRAMLYGVPTRERDRQGYIAEKNRYQPWSGAPMEGEVRLSWRGKELTIRRGPKGAAPFGAFSAVYTDTGESVPGLTAENCGETLLGVSRTVWERSAFVGQGGAAIGADAELERRIAALVSSGEEEVSYSQVEKRLRDWQNRRKHNKTGIIPKLENELAVLDDTLARQERAMALASDARGDIEALSAEQGALKTALDAHEARRKQEKYQKYQAALAAREAARAEVDALAGTAERLPDGEALREAQGELAYDRTLEANLKLLQRQREEAEEAAREAEALAADPLFPGMSADEAWRRAGADRDAAAAKPSGRGWFAACAVLSAAAGVCLVWLLFRALTHQALAAWSCWVPMGAAAAALGCGAFGRFRAGKERRERAAILERYGVESPDDILKKAGDYRDRQTAAREAEEKVQAMRREAGRMEEERKALLERLLALARSFEPAVTDLFGVSAALSRGLGVREKLATARARLEGAEALAESLKAAEARAGEPVLPPDGPAPEELSARLAQVNAELLRCKNTLAMAQGELNTLGDPALFRARREELTEELARRREEYEALGAALEALDGANAQLRARFSPALNAAAGAILARLTGGKYGEVALTRQFEAAARDGESPLPRQAIALSQGTAEQIYLAVRLAVCEMALPADEPSPLVLDDVLDTYDDGRMALALEYLKEEAQKRQILLFSCHSREKAYLER